ncbi:hypothetical protein KXQ82_15600 [Mucilaginibacter sp. HMF5004]|uniref:hypothetical protein n=1 Tax=Mucilaginibacter rivuli TaxID=2857527 RepID=UPI001C5F3AA6|nr:hypothetical protein [Mucilaginibacter rivuli]MBW4891150.1 hypothetical protein [Mucilaginibacter rivuli]
MKQKLPEFLLCEDPTSTDENLFIYYMPTRSLVHIVHTDVLSETETAKIKSAGRRHFYYTYKNAVGNTEKIIFFAQVVDKDEHDEQDLLEKCAHWYACYLGWEDDCEDIVKSA